MNHHTWAVVLLECAWILWMQSPEISQPDRWSIANSFPTQVACMQRLEDVLNRTKTKPRTEVREQTIFTTSGEHISRLTVHCIPETIDPRQPKR
jgi:hypothetical protein